MSGISTTKATGMTHEWMTDALASPGVNAQIEGSDATYGTLTPRTRVNNYIQNIRKTGQISDNQQAVLKAGVKDEYGHQLMKATKELALDTERAFIQGPKSLGATATAAYMGGLMYWVTTNASNMATTLFTGTGPATGGAATTITLAVGDGAASAVAAGDYIYLTGGTGQGQYRTVTGVAGDVVTISTGTTDWDITPVAASTTYIIYHTPLALTETVVNDNLQLCFEAGGSPDTLFVSPKQKRAISGFASSIRRLTSTEQKLTNSIDVYESDFGAVSVKTNRWMPAGVIAAVESAKFRAAYLRPVKAEEMPRSGSSRKFMIESAVTLESLAENASGVIRGAL